MRIAGFNTPFGLSGDLGVGLTSILGGDAGGTPTAASVLSAGTRQPGVYAALAAAAHGDQTPTQEALSLGKLTVKQHNVIAAVAAGNGTATSISWNNNGTEPDVVAKMRSYGWLKLVKPNYSTKTRMVTAATYVLTPVGKAIGRRTGGGGVSTVA